MPRRHRRPGRTVEELKDRFYSIQRALLRVRNGRDPDLKRHPMFIHEFDMEYERCRKDELEKLQRRTLTQEQKIALTVIQARKLNRRIKKLKRTLGEKAGFKIRAVAEVKEAEPPVSPSIQALKRSQNVVPKHRLPSPEAPAAIASSSSTRKPPGRRIKPPAPAEPAPLDVFTEMDEETEVKLASIPDNVIAKGVVPEPKEGVILRSEQIMMPLKNQGTKAIKALENELVSIGLTLKKPRPFAVPTNDVYRHYKNLRTDILTLVNMRNFIQKKEQERDSMRSMLRTHNKVGPGTPYEFGTKKDKRKMFPNDNGETGSFKRRRTTQR